MTLLFPCVVFIHRSSTNSLAFFHPTYLMILLEYKNLYQILVTKHVWIDVRGLNIWNSRAYPRLRCPPTIFHKWYNVLYLQGQVCQGRSSGSHRAMLQDSPVSRRAALFKYFLVFSERYNTDIAVLINVEKEFCFSYIEQLWRRHSMQITSPSP